MRRLILLSCLLLLPVADAEAKPPKKALKVLNLLKQVDGAGSGLDADTVRGLSPLVVRDANGAPVGPVVDALVLNGSPSDTEVGIVRRLNGLPVRLSVSSDGFVETSLLLDYVSADCTGAPLLATTVTQPLPFIPHAQVARGVAYYAAGLPIAVNPGSFEAPEDQGCLNGTPLPSHGTCCYPGSRCADLPCGFGVPVATTDLSTLGLVPPFHVEGP